MRAFVVPLLLAAAACGPGPGGDAPPAATGVAAVVAGPPGVATADSLVGAWVEAGRVPGAVLRVTRGELTFERSYGHAQLDPQRGMTAETVFDLASVTKVMATTLALMRLSDGEAFDVRNRVWQHLPAFHGPARDSVTLEHLLTHTAGLPRWYPVYYHADNELDAFRFVQDIPLQWGVGEGRHYSDLGFMLLGRIVEVEAPGGLAAFLQGSFYGPLGLEHTGFTPAPGDGPFAATSHGNPFERRMVQDTAFGYRIDIDPMSWDGWRSHQLVGEVNDGNAHHAYDGVAGHAGLFSTAGELDVLLRLLLNGGEYDGLRYVSERVVQDFLTPRLDGQALGWQLPDYAPEGSFAHTGFTGTLVMGVPALDLSLVLLTNRQNRGVDAETRYPDLGPLQRGVVEALTR